MAWGLQSQAAPNFDRPDMRLTAFLPSLLLLLLSLPAQVLAQPTAFDPSFDVDGERQNPFPTLSLTNRDFRLQAMALDDEGRILLGGTDTGVVFPHGSLARVGRLLANGSPDATYGVNGLAQFDRNGATGWVVRALLALPDGSAFACGDVTINDSLRYGFAVRLTPQGVKDPQWAPGSQDNVVLMGLPGHTGSRCFSIDLLGDGRLVLAGSSTRQGSVGPYTRPVLMLLDPQGYPDPAFGDQGLAVVEVPGVSPASTHALRVLEQPGAGLLVRLGDAGVDSQTAAVDAYTVRLDLQGRLDSSFRIRAHWNAAYGDPYTTRGENESEHLAVLPGGSFQVATPLLQSSGRQFDKVRATRLPRDGQLANEGGEIWDAVLGAESSELYPLASGMALAPDGSTVLAGRKGYSFGGPACHRDGVALYLTRLLDTGSRDLGFGLFGHHSWMPDAGLVGCSEGIDHGEEVVLSRDGRILVLSTMSQEIGSTLLKRPVLHRFQGQPFATPPEDIEPAPVVLGSTTARPNALAASDFVQVTGLGTGVRVPAYVIGGELRLGFGPWQSTPMWVRNGDWLQVRAMAPSTANASATARLVMGGIRGQHSWASLGPRVESDFVVTAALASLPGERCTEGALNTNCSVPIPDLGSVESTINFVNPGSCNFISRVRVGVDISHSWIGDLRLVLTDPNGQVFIGGSEGVVNLLDRPRADAQSAPGSCLRADVQAVFDDAAGLDAQTSCGVPLTWPALSGERRPHFALSQLSGRRTTGSNGASANGLWKLTVSDLAGGNSGQLHDWSLDLDCTASAPAVSDLSVSVAGPAAPVAGEAISLAWTVTNLGPSSTSNGRFRATLPSELAASLDDPAWACSTSGGGSCSLPAWCQGVCLGHEIDVGLNLPVGASATIVADATLTELASGGQLSVVGRSSTPLTLGGTGDNNPGNDEARYQAGIVRVTDLAVTRLQHQWQGQELSIEADFSNLGPSLADGFSLQLDLPDGLLVSDFMCERLPFDCAGSLGLGAGNVLTLTGASLLPSRTPYTLRIRAQWPGAESPGQVVAIVTADAGASDPDATNSHESQLLTAPGTTPPSGDRVFGNGFE